MQRTHRAAGVDGPRRHPVGVEDVHDEVTLRAVDAAYEETAGRARVRWFPQPPDRVPAPRRRGVGHAGQRRLGWAWDDSGRNDLLRATGCVVGSVVQHSLRAGDVPAAVYDDLARAADRHLTDGGATRSWTASLVTT